MSEFLKNLMKDLEKGNELVFRLTPDGVGVAMEKRSLIGYLDADGGGEGSGITGCCGGDNAAADCKNCERLPRETRETLGDESGDDDSDSDSDFGEELTVEELIEVAKAKARAIAVLIAMADALEAGECDFLKGAADLSAQEMVYLAEEILDAADDQEMKFKDWCVCDFVEQMIDGMMESMEFVTEPSDVSKSGDGRSEAEAAKDEPSGVGEKNPRASFAGASE